MPILFAPLHHLTDQNSQIASYSTLYCDIPSDAFHSVSLVFLLLPFVTAILLSVWITSCLVRLYHRHRNSLSSGLDLPLGRRFFAMALITLISTLLLIVNASTDFSTKALLDIIVVWESISPLLQFGVFATQQEVVSVWLAWLRGNFRPDGAIGSNHSAYSMQQAPQTNVIHRPTVFRPARESRPLPPLPPPDADVSTTSLSSAPRPAISPVYPAIQLELPGSRLSIPTLLRNRTPTPTPQILTAGYVSAETPVLSPEGGEHPDAEEPFSASVPLVSSSTRRGYDTPVLPPTPVVPNGSQRFFSPFPAPQHFRRDPVMPHPQPQRVRSLPAPKKRFSGPPGSSAFSPRSAVVPYEIPPPPTRPAPTAPSSTNGSSNGHTAPPSRSVSINSSSQWSPATTRSSQSRSLFTRFAPNMGRRSAPAPTKRPSMREIIAQFPTSPGSPGFPTMPLPLPLPPPALVARASVTVGPIRETIQLAEPSPPPRSARPPAIDQHLAISRNVALQAASVPIDSARSVEAVGPASPPGRSLTHAYSRSVGSPIRVRPRQQMVSSVDETPGGSSSRAPPSTSHTEEFSDPHTPISPPTVWSSRRDRPRSVSRSRPGSSSLSVRSPSASVARLTSDAPRRSVTYVPPVPSRPASTVASPASHTSTGTRPLNIRPRESIRVPPSPPPLPPKGGSTGTYPRTYI
ncbi:hypothetical protein EXIGLDRAFT_486478 [Exidia glandulosa HHB12029]|nr:hypothetical protein EXIGLDRAFT_486478 [Exidia glandulosa HHB12029]